MELKTCEGCGGRGIVDYPMCEWPHSWSETGYCYDCEGTGYVMDQATVDMLLYLIRFDDDSEVTFTEPLPGWVFLPPGVIPT